MRAVEDVVATAAAAAAAVAVAIAANSLQSSPNPGLDIQTARQNFKRPKNREDSSDLDENLTESIVATQTFI